MDLQSVESFIHFSRALEPSFSYIGGTLRGSSCDDDIGEDEDNDMEACPVGSDERHSRNTQRIVRQEGKEVTRGAINITRSASTTRSTCPSTSPGPAHPFEISSSSNSGLSSFSSSLSTSVSSLSSLSHGPSPGMSVCLSVQPPRVFYFIILVYNYCCDWGWSCIEASVLFFVDCPHLPLGNCTDFSEHRDGLCTGG